MKFRNYDKYEVFEDGRIWSYKYRKFLKPSTVKGGYQQVELTDNEGKCKRYYVHRIVWEAFTGAPIPSNMQINHRNEIKTDNRFFENLELVSPKQNINYGSRNERARKSLTNNPKTSKPVGAFKDGKLVMTFLSTSEARRNGFSQGNVWACCRNCYLREGNNKYKGFEWKYI